MWYALRAFAVKSVVGQDICMRKSFLVMCILGLASTLLAQIAGTPRIVRVPEKSAIHVPGQPIDAGLKIIYSNLGPTKTNLYSSTNSWAVAGPGTGFSTFLGLAFTPKANSHVTQVRVALWYFGGANQINLNIYADAGGLPGTLLAGPVTVTNLPTFGTCCSLVVADFPSLAVAAGTKYWVVANTPLSGTGSDFDGSWPMVNTPEMAWDNSDFGWFPSNPVAGAVLGTIP